MAVRKFIVVAGQNQATEVANATEWEDNHLYAAIRSPRNADSQTPDYASGPYNDILTLPFTFKGGPQSDNLGATTFGSHQTANVMGKATQAIKYLTFYDPTASYQNLGTQTTSCYPGTGKVLAGSTSTSLVTSVFWQYSPQNLVITRRKTGTTHTIESTNTGTTVTLSNANAFVPPPEPGELFDFVPTAGAAGSETTVKLRNEFGGIADPGSAGDPTTGAAIDSNGRHPCYINRILKSDGTNDSGRVVCRSRPVYVGQPVKFANQSPISVPSDFNTSDVFYVTRKAQFQETVTSSSYTSSDNEINFASSHGLGTGEPVQLTISGTLANFNATSTYYVIVVDADEIKLASTLANALAGTAIAIESSDSGTVTLTRLDSYAAFFVSTSPGGDEVVATTDSGQDPSAAQNLKISFESSFRGSLTGLQLRCLSGTEANVGFARAIHDVKFVGGSDNINVLTTEAFPEATAMDDTFAIEVPPLNNQSIPFEKWAMWLPWSPFEGSAPFDGPATVAITSTATALTVTVQDSPTLVGGIPSVGSAVKFFTNGALTSPLVPGKMYIVSSVDGSTLTLQDLDAVDVSKMVGVDGGTATGESFNSNKASESGANSRHVMFVFDQDNKSNPYPPGFNYPNHHATPRAYQPFDGPGQISIDPSISFHPSLALKMHEHTGETMHVLVCAMRDTSIGHKEVAASTDAITPHGWLDQAQQKSWSPGEPNNCFARLEDMLDAAKLAFEADGDTGDCIGIFWAQGEEDARHQPLADNYKNSASKIRSSIRKAIKDRSLTSLEEDKIPFIHPKITTSTIWTYASTVNAAIQDLADEDHFTRTFEVSRFELTADKNPSSINGSVKIHYSGVGMTSLAESAYSAWKDTQQMTSQEIDICNLALAHIGDKATVTSLNPSDGSHQADLCARYYPVARDLCLERHRYDFTIKQSALVALTTSGRTDFEYAYRLPSDFAGAISVIAKDSLDDQVSAGIKIPQPFVIELNDDYDRIIYCNLQDAVIRYQAKVTDSSQFSRMFVYAVSWQLASMLAGALIKGDEGMGAVRNAGQMAEFYMQKAAAFDSRTTREKPVVDANTNPWDR